MTRLKEINIQNFAIIDNLHLEFHSGFVVFTGETGAGKSIILDALDVVLGGKAAQEMIRSGAEKAVIECVFEVDGKSIDLNELLLSEDLFEEDRSLILSREIRMEGRTTARINGRSVSTSFLKEVGQLLVDIHGQTEHLSIFNPRTHIELLDRYANFPELVREYTNAYSNYLKVNRELTSLRSSVASAAERADLLKFQVEEIEKAKLRLNEDLELKQERDRLANAEALAQFARQSLQVLDEGSYESPAVTDQFGILTGFIHSLAKLDASNQIIADKAEGIAEEINDLIIALRDYSDSIEFNPARLETVEDRIDLINTLKRKYGAEIEDILQKKDKSVLELESLSTSDATIQQLEELRQVFIRQITEIGKKLSQKRNKAAQKLSQSVETELEQLKMSAARFEIRIESADFSTTEHGKEPFGKNGFDSVEFMIAPNIGEGFKPLVKIASGGETSRLMLALKNSLAKADQIPTLVFDEIDQGIGGRIGSIVGQKLYNLSLDHQVFCVTHLPQLAAYGTQHFKVDKFTKDDRTTTSVKQIEDEERVIELSQMFGELSDGTLASAREIINKARALMKE
ncbi:MAG TPA: DNA repair protein RecN [Anaerolineales bacterium]|nr:DNA repair protein RecN [Anaerolineales bacterium]